MKSETRDIGGLRRCGILFSVAMALVAWFFLWQNHFGGFFFSFLAFFLLSITLFRPLLFKGPYRMWMKMSALPISVLRKLFLTLFFFCVLTPIGLIARLLQVDFLNTKMPKSKVSSYWDKGPDSYWVPRKKKDTCTAVYEKQH